LEKKKRKKKIYTGGAADAEGRDLDIECWDRRNSTLG